MTFSQKMHAVINSPVRKHIFYAAHSPQKQRRPSADPVGGGGRGGSGRGKGPLIGNPIVPVFQWERPRLLEESACDAGPSFPCESQDIFSPGLKSGRQKNKTPQRKHFSRPRGMPRKSQFVEKLVTCRWEVRNFEQSIMFTVYTLEMGEMCPSFPACLERERERKKKVADITAGSQGCGPQRDIQSVPFSLKWKWVLLLRLKW